MAETSDTTVEYKYPSKQDGSLQSGQDGDDTAKRLSAMERAEDLGLDDPLKQRKGRDLVWKDINMTLSSKGDEPKKKILDGVWGEVPKRQVTAIMGPSGSGKTSLLNILAGRLRTGGRLTIEADVRLNNYVVDPTNMEVRKKIAFVAQDDSLPVTATPREAIRFSARFRLPATMTNEELNNLTNRMLEELGLQDCADTLVGGTFVKGLSGGERKRTSVGVELVTRPALVFLDEPTSGLDSFNAVQLCQLLKKVANAGSSVLFTIHQPSSDIFHSFDRLLLLNNGRVMYQGSIKDLPPYFSERGHPCPPKYNPADWVMSVALSHSIEELDEAGYFPKNNREIVEAYTTTDEDGVLGKDVLGIPVDTKGKEEKVDDTGLGLWSQTILLFQREVQNVFRNTQALKARTLMTILMSLASGCIFFRVAKTDFAEFINAQTAFGALLMSLLANVITTAMPSLLAFPEERPVFLREYSTNHYSVLAYFASKLWMEVLVTGVQVSVNSVITYFMVGFDAKYGIFWSGLYVMAMTSTALGVFVGCSVTNATTAVEFLPAIIVPQILFSGFVTPPSLVPTWLSWIRFLCPLTYGVKILVAAEYGHGRCNGLVPDNCQQIMDNTQVNPNDTWWYFLVLLCLFLFIRIFALVNLKRKAAHFYYSK